MAMRAVLRKSRKAEPKRPRLTLRAKEPTEAEVLGGVLQLCRAHKGVTIAVRVNCGEFVVLRPPAAGWGSLRAQLAIAIQAGILSEGQIGWVRGAPADTPDILGVMADGRALALEVKRPGGRIRPGQAALIARIVAAGGLAAVVESVDQADRVLSGRIGA
jgi:hypothetical protein